MVIRMSGPFVKWIRVSSNAFRLMMPLPFWRLPYKAILPLGLSELQGRMAGLVGWFDTEAAEQSEMSCIDSI